MKKINFNDWCKSLWLKFSLLITGVMIVLTLIFWDSWSASLKCIAAVAALIPVHATEEWFFPGGFAYQYNLFMYKSEKPRYYHMNRASDMVTVLGTTIMYAVIVFVFMFTGKAVPSGVLLGATCFSFLEVSVHTYFGIRAYQKFKGKGKTTIYSAGMMTAYTGFLPLVVIMIRQIVSNGIKLSDVVICLLILGITSVLCFVPEKKFKDINSPYAYPDCGYYEKYLH